MPADRPPLGRPGAAWHAASYDDEYGVSDAAVPTASTQPPNHTQRTVFAPRTEASPRHASGEPEPSTVHVPAQPRPSTNNNHHAAGNGGPVRQPGVSVEISVVKMLRNKVSEQLAERIRVNPAVTVEVRRVEGERIAAVLVGEYVNELLAAGKPPAAGYEAALLDAVAADLFGMGALQQLLKDPSIVNIHAVGCDHVRIEHSDGRLSQGPPLAETDAELIGILQMLAMRDSATERSFSSVKPWVDLQMPDGSRLTALQQVAQRPVVTIRRHTVMDVRLEDLRDRFGLMDHLICDFLKAAMKAGCNIMVAGLAAAGKTTLLRALAREIPPAEAFVTLEESRELGLHTTGYHPWCISLEAREGHGEWMADGRKAGEVTIADLIPLTLRMSTRRIIVGEVRSREIVPMLQAMTTSKGSMCTIHSRDPRSVIDRIIELALSHGQEMRADLARRMAAGALDLIVYLTVEDETAVGGSVHRYVSEIVEVGGMSGETMVTTTIFGPGPDGRAVPKHLPERLLGPLMQVGYDPRILAQYRDNGSGTWNRPLETMRGRPS